MIPSSVKWDCIKTDHMGLLWKPKECAHACVCVITYVFGHVCNYIYHIHVTVHGRASMYSWLLGTILLLCYHIILYSYIVVMLYIILLLCILYYSIVIVMYCCVLYYYYFSHSPYATIGRIFNSMFKINTFMPTHHHLCCHHQPWPDPCQSRPCQTTQTPWFHPCPVKV